jgi:hypothetical protein
MQGKMERLLDCPVAGKEVRVMEIHETCRPTMSCCLSSRVLLSRCEEEERCRQRESDLSCPLWDEVSASRSEELQEIEWKRF